MDHFEYRAGVLHAEAVSVATLAARYGTPLYIYSRATLERHYRAFESAFAAHPHRICYAVKANSNLAVLAVLARLGSGFDIVSGGELARVLAAGGDPARVVFSGVGKRVDEIAAALDAGIGCFNVESEAELQRINRIAGERGLRAPVALRVNPDVDAATHPYIATGLKENKFGIEIGAARALYRAAQVLPHLHIRGIACHIGSQLTQTGPFVDALARVLALLDELAADGIEIEHLDIGGGLGIRYRDEAPPEPADYAHAVLQTVGSRTRSIHLEPGRAIVGNAGILVTRVEHLKHSAERHFAIVDAAMNDLIRPALYGAWQAIVPVTMRAGDAQSYDIVGPVCETGDFLGKERTLCIEEGDLLAVRSAGAYGFVMSSNYNTRPRAAEILVHGDQVHLARRRETVHELLALESVPTG
jgi:diaminopimelate decarboxylase